MTVDIPWGDEDAAVARLSHGIDELLRRAGDGGWQIAWCAGIGVPATPEAQLVAEHRVLAAFLSALALRHAQTPHVRGALFLASSAGAVYAGGQQPPFDELSEANPISGYGRAKLAQEQLVVQFGGATGVPTFVGRISNLFGPGQNLAKPQGIISQLCRAHLTAQPVSIYVPMDTIRDYLFVDDCATKIVDGLQLMRQGTIPSSMTKILASQQAVTIGAVLGEFRRVFAKRPYVVLGSSELSSVQSLDLRLRSVVAPEIDRRPLTPLGAGIDATARDLSFALQSGRLPRRI